MITNIDYINTLRALAKKHIRITFLKYQPEKGKLLLQVSSPTYQIEAKEALSDIFEEIELAGMSTLVLKK